MAARAQRETCVQMSIRPTKGHGPVAKPRGLARSQPLPLPTLRVSILLHPHWSSPAEPSCKV